MHAQAPSGFGEIVFALSKSCLDVFERGFVGIDWIFRRRPTLSRCQKCIGQFCRICWFRQKINGSELNGGHDRRDVSIARQNNRPIVSPQPDQFFDQVETATVLQSEINN